MPLGAVGGCRRLSPPPLFQILTKLCSLVLAFDDAVIRFIISDKEAIMNELEETCKEADSSVKKLSVRLQLPTRHLATILHLLGYVWVASLFLAPWLVEFREQY